MSIKVYNLFKVPQHPLQSTTPSSLKYHTTLIKIAHTKFKVTICSVRFMVLLKSRPGMSIAFCFQNYFQFISSLFYFDQVFLNLFMLYGICRRIYSLCFMVFICLTFQDDLCETFFAFNRGKGQLYDGTTRLYTELNNEPIAM